jgi:hypothetical protein
MQLLPPKQDVCQQCANENHTDPEQPHDQQSLYWQYWFYGQNGRWHTWNDAMAHCSNEVKQIWITSLKNHGVEIETEAV